MRRTLIQPKVTFSDRYGEVEISRDVKTKESSAERKLRYFCGDTSLHGCEYIPRFAKAGLLGWLHRIIWTSVIQTKNQRITKS